VHTLALNVLGRGVRVRSADHVAGVLLAAAYGAMRSDAVAANLEYTVRRAGAPTGGFQLERSGRPPVVAPDDGTLLARFDADLAVEIQRLRPDLYVVHAAVLGYGAAAVMLVAKSGGGKSTLSWALLQQGLAYLSDELAPIGLARLDVLPYPRALMVKREPPPSHPLPAGTVRTSRGFHVPTAAMPGEVRTRPAPLAAIFFLHHAPGTRPSVRRITPAEGAARLYANTLNPLAHPGDGIDAAIRVATARPCFELVTSDLGATCALVIAELGGAA
jgi:hypothetical protein